MGWLSGPQRKAVGLQVNDGTQNTIVIPALPGGRPNGDGVMYPDASYQSSALSGYGRNELVYACIRKLSENLPQSFLRVYPAGLGGEPLEGHRLRQLFAQPNPTTTEFEFFELSVTYLQLAGNCYWLIVRGRDGLPSELWPLRPDLIRIFPSANPRVWRYGYVLDPSVLPMRPAEVIPIARNDIVHVKLPNPVDQYFGQPPLRPAARAVSLDNAATDFVDTLLRNHAVPGVVIETAETTTQEVADIIKARWKAAYGSQNKGEPAVLQAGMKVHTLGMNLRDLEFPDLRAISESRICAAFGVPPVLVGAKVGLDRSTFTNYGEAERQLWQEGIFSLQWRFRDAVTTRLLPEFSGVGRQRVLLAWDNSEVIALKEAERDKWERATNALARGGLSINDFRRTVGLDPVGGGDVFLMPAGVVPQPTDGSGMAPAEPEAAAELEAASYAREFLVELERKGNPKTVNGHAVVR